MSKTILLISTPFSPNIGGVETHLDDLLSVGIKKGWNFLVITYQPLVTNTLGKTVEKGVGFRILRIPWLRFNLFLNLEKYPALEFLYLFPGLFLGGLITFLNNLKQIKIIHAQGLVAGSVGVVLGKLFRKPVILSTHSIYNFPSQGFYPKFVLLIFNNCQKILTLSEQSRREVIRLGLETKKVIKFTYWVDQKIFSPSNKRTVRKKLSLPNDKFICLFVGRLVPPKGVMQLLRAANKFNNQVMLLIAGDGPLANIVIKASRKENVKFVGKVDNSLLPDYYNAADVLIVPSVHEEGYGRVILEALSCGLPVVVSNRGGIKESVSSEVGYLIDITAENISQIINKLSKNKSALKALSASARNYALANFSLKNASVILKSYEQE